MKTMKTKTANHLEEKPLRHAIRSIRKDTRFNSHPLDAEGCAFRGFGDVPGFGIGYQFKDERQYGMREGWFLSLNVNGNISRVLLITGHLGRVADYAEITEAIETFTDID